MGEKMKHTFTLALAIILLAAVGWGETNDYSSMFNYNTTAWNFTVEAKNLTQEEKEAFDAMAGDGRGMFGRQYVEVIASRVRALDAQREIEKILADVKALEQTNKTTKVTFDPVAFPKLPADFVLELTTHTATNNYIPPSPSFIRKLAASGAICKVFGHWYPNVWIGERKCKLCGKVDTNKTMRWIGGGDGGDGLDLIEGDSDGFRIIKRKDRK